MFQSLHRVAALAGLTLSVTAFAGGSTDDEIRFVRYPGVANDGTIAFSYHGDLWVAEADGANPRRLTAHVARDVHPRFSPDGKTIAFTSDRLGNDDAWLIPVAGGEPRAITRHSTGDTVLNWMPDGRGVLIASTRGANPWGSPLHVAHLDGTQATPLAMDRGASGMVAQNGALVAFNRTGFRYWRKGYRGNNNTDVWVQRLDGGPITQLTDLDMKQYREHTQDAHPMWGADGRVYFMSERDGVFNIWRIAPDGGDPEQVTFHDGDGIQYPSIAPDGSAIVYESEFSIWRVALPDGKPERIAIELTFDPKDNFVEYVDVASTAGGFSASPDGKSVAVENHGEIMIVPVDAERGELRPLTSSPWRDRYQSWSPDGKSIAWISDASGDEEIWIFDVENGRSHQLTEHASTKRSFMWSPDATTIAYTADQRLFLVDVASGEQTELAHNPEGGYSLSSFSPKGEWLVYSRSNGDLDREVYLLEIAGRREINVTQSRFRESGGWISGDGKHVLFTSDRSGTNHLYAVSLTKLTEDPDDPLNRREEASADGRTGPPGDGERRRRGRPRGENAGDGQEAPPERPQGRRRPPQEEENAEEQETAGAEESLEDEEPEDEGPETLEIDLDGIEARARALTSGSDDVFTVIMAPDGKKAYYIQGGALHAIGIDGRDGKQVAEGSFGRLQLTGDGSRFFYSAGRGGGRGRFGGGGGGSAISTMRSSGGSASTVDFAYRVKVDHRDEWRQVFNEAWRVMKYRFYDPAMHGVDWEAMKAKYEAFLPYVGENQDLYDLANEMIGELNASHTGVSGPGSRSMPRLVRTMNLGFEIAAKDGYYRVTHVHARGPADREWLDLNVGDCVLALGGHDVRPPADYVGLLNDPLNDYVEVKAATPTIADDGDAEILAEPRTLRIRASSSMRSAMYRAWVERNRDLVDEWSGGKVGYVHIRSMNQSSLEQFRTEIDQFWNKNGMIIDIRYNGGGNTDQQIIDILERKPYEYWNFRQGGRAAGRRPRQAIAGPQVMLINWRSASDSEVTPQAFRDLGLGRIVGNPTYGAVIATGSYRLMNGGSIRTPGSLVVTYDPTNEHNYGINLENFGVAPDVWVENSPQDELDGFDRELKTAVEEALKMLAEGTWQFGEDD